jgi:hypothetical protein
MQMKMTLLAVPVPAATRTVCVSVALALCSAAAFAQQPPAAPLQSPAAPQGYTGAYGPSGPPTPYYTGPLPEVSPDTGRTIVGPNNTSVTAKAVPCSTAARSTDGTTTCIGIPDRPLKTRY